jgi:DnaJ family protein C protein 2
MTRSLQGLNLEEGAQQFASWAAELDSRLEKERAQVMESAIKGSGSRAKAGNTSEWTPEDLQLLIKAVNLFPAGTNQR